MPCDQCGRNLGTLFVDHLRGRLCFSCLRAAGFSVRSLGTLGREIPKVPPLWEPGGTGAGPEGPVAAPSENGTAAPKGRDIKAPHPNLSVDDLAVAKWISLTKLDGKPPSVARVAREIKRNRRHLYRCRNFMSLVATEKRGHRLPRGWKGPSRQVEAIQDE